MVLTSVISTVFNSIKNCDCSKLFYTKTSEESVQRVKRAQLCAIRNILILSAAVFCSVYRIQPPINLTPQNTTHTD